MSPFFIASLSLMPGLGHLALGKKGKAAALFVIDLGIVIPVLLMPSGTVYVFAAAGYLLTMIPAGVETYQMASGGVSRFSQSKHYIAAMLIKEGFSALPLLWQSSAFSQRAKIGWTIAVPILAALYFGIIGLFAMHYFAEKAI